MHRLVTIPFSHFCEKARWALDHARVPYEEDGHVPLLHRRAVKTARGKGGSVPVLVLEGGGGVLDDSPLIVKWADSHAASDRKLLPAGGTERDEALALERHLDLDYAPHVRRLAYFHVLPDRARTLELMRIATPRMEQVFVRAGFPLLRALMRRGMGIDAARAQRSRDRLLRVLDEMETRLRDGRPYLMGDRFGAVDIAFAAFSSPLLLPPEHPVMRERGMEPPQGLTMEAGALREREAGRFVLRLYRERRAPAAAS
jgi:glutathione S-transferase